MNTERENIANENGMSIEFVNWFFDNKKAGCGNVWFMMMAAMWEGWKPQNEKLTESERKVEQLAAENAALKESVEHASGCIHAAEVEGLIDAIEEKNGERLADLIHRRLCHAYLPVETPATDAILAEVRANGVDVCRNALIKFVEDEVGPNENVPGLIRGAEVCVSIAAQIRQEAK